jgi:hypothetical protein
MLLHDLLVASCCDFGQPLVYLGQCCYLLLLLLLLLLLGCCCCAVPVRRAS